ncbi:MAG: type I restriction endonuclease subunit R [Mycoplasma sp.]|nr:type I restriction endonuclease subunit R [Mycoplasma sp.]
MTRPLAEINFEDIVIESLEKLGYDTSYNFFREKLSQAVDFDLLKKQIIKINKISEELADKVILNIRKIHGDAIEQNIVGTSLLNNGVKVFDDKEQRTRTFKLLSDNKEENIFSAIRQFELIDSNGTKRFPDIVCFLNGLPIIIFELKAPDANERLEEAFKQNNSLKNQFPNVYSFNIFDILSNDLDTKFGSITSPFKKYFSLGMWSKDNDFELILSKENILKYIKLYSFYNNDHTIKYIAAKHQYQAVENTITKMLQGNHKGGVVWHTQGSGKSVTMLFLTRAINLNFNSATTLVITDRNALDRQLFKLFADASEYLLSIPKGIESRKDLIEKLEDKKHYGVYFSTVQKFADSTGLLSNRDDIFILIDEAHRSQNNISGERVLNKKDKEFSMKFGFAKFMRDAFPKAILTGFTGTPLMGDKTTTDIFGGYNHKYSMNDSVKDGSTVPILYESRKVSIDLSKEYLSEMDKIQREYAKTLDVNDVQSEDKLKTLLKSVKVRTVLEDPDVIKAKTKDILQHLNLREKVLNGKAMIVASSRKAAFNYYSSIIELEPNRKESTILVMTHNNKDSNDEREKIVPKKFINNVAAEFRKDNSKYKIAIVVDMWLTGFDVPDLDVMYIDKIIKWHNLMQAIARVNRTYEKGDKNKVSGLIVDYLGIWKHLSDALIQYADGSSTNIDIVPEDIEKAKTKLQDFVDIIEDNFIPGIKSFSGLDSKQQYKFIMFGFNKILELSQLERNKFILLSRKITRLIKMSFTLINKELSTNAKAISIINSLLSTKNTQEDEMLNITIEKIKEAVEMAINTKKSDIFIKSTKINKDINQVTQLLEDEAKQLKESNPLVSKKLLEDAINGKINRIKKFRPMFAKKASDKLLEILTNLEKDATLQEVIDGLIVLSKEITEKMLEKPEFSDPNLQAFFTILADDDFLKMHQNSEVLKAIAKDLMDSVKENITPQFYKNKKVKDKVIYHLMQILWEKYNYPPEKAGGLSGILIDRIEKNISFNSEYFIKKKEVL